jgi:hypothetical protein
MIVIYHASPYSNNFQQYKSKKRRIHYGCASLSFGGTYQQVNSLNYK